MMCVLLLATIIKPNMFKYACIPGGLCFTRIDNNIKLLCGHSK